MTAKPIWRGWLAHDRHGDGAASAGRSPALPRSRSRRRPERHLDRAHPFRVRPALATGRRLNGRSIPMPLAHERQPRMFRLDHPASTVQAHRPDAVAKVTRSTQSRPIGACSFSLSGFGGLRVRSWGRRLAGESRRRALHRLPLPIARHGQGAAGPGRQLRCRQLPTHRLQVHLRRELGRGSASFPRPPRRPSCRAKQAHPPGRNSGVTSGFSPGSFARH